MWFQSSSFQGNVILFQGCYSFNLFVIYTYLVIFAHKQKGTASNLMYHRYCLLTIFYPIFYLVIIFLSFTDPSHLFFQFYFVIQFYLVIELLFTILFTMYTTETLISSLGDICLSAKVKTKVKSMKGFLKLSIQFLIFW